MQVYRYGASIGFYAVSYVFTMLITSEVFLPVFYKLGITSTYEVSLVSQIDAVSPCVKWVNFLSQVNYSGLQQAFPL